MICNFLAMHCTTIGSYISINTGLTNNLGVNHCNIMCGVYLKTVSKFHV